MTESLLARLGAHLPIVGAPLGGGPSTPALVTAVARAGGIGFLAAGYKTVEAIAEQIASVRAEGAPFGVNVFAPNPVPVERDAFRSYAAAIQPEADRYGLDLSTVDIVEDDDRWATKIELLLADPVALVSFTFGLPDADVVARLQRAGTAVVLTVTSPDEAALAAARHPDALAVQSADAGGHLGTLSPLRPPPPMPLVDLLRSVRAVTDLPLIGAGGIGTSRQVADATAAGAEAVMVGTALLRTDESGASQTHRRALADPHRTTTVVTRAFTGRPARALTNDFTDRYSASAPSGYPALHHLTGPLRRAAAAAGDADRVHLWAGTGYRHARSGPAAEVIADLARDL